MSNMQMVRWLWNQSARFYLISLRPSACSLSSNPLAHSVRFACRKKSTWLALTFILLEGGHWVVSALSERSLHRGHGFRPGDAESPCSGALGANHVSSLPRSRAKQQWKKTGTLEQTCRLQKVNILCVLWGIGISNPPLSKLYYS